MFFIFFGTAQTALSPKLFYYSNKEKNLEKYENNYINLTKSLIEEVDLYMKEYGKGTRLNAELLVRLSDLYNIDLKLVLAQAHLESHFGTRGSATRTNSVFNVGTYDDGTFLYKYKHHNYSIEPYMKLLVENYLVDKNTNELLENNKFINTEGSRYASDKMYERSLQEIIKKINEDTSIDSILKIRKFTIDIVESLQNDDEIKKLKLKDCKICDELFLANKL